jgi:CheY-like chemotaxis protein
MNVLIVDDSELACELMSSTLHQHGHRVLAVRSPIGVTRTVLKERIDVAVIDVNLPTIHGDRLAMMFRKQTRLDHVGLVLVSSIDPEALAGLGEACASDAVVSKADITEKLPLAVLKAYKARR